VPLLNDHLFHDPLKIRFSLIIVVFCAAVAAMILLMIVRPVYRQKVVESASWQ